MLQFRCKCNASIESHFHSTCCCHGHCMLCIYHNCMTPIFRYTKTFFFQDIQFLFKTVLGSVVSGLTHILEELSMITIVGRRHVVIHHKHFIGGKSCLLYNGPLRNAKMGLQNKKASIKYIQQCMYMKKKVPDLFLA